MSSKYPTPVITLLLLLLFVASTEKTCLSFQSDELLVDDEDFGLEDGVQIGSTHPDIGTASPPPPSQVQSTRRKSSATDGDSKIEFYVEHAFGSSDFLPAGTFTARLKTSSHSCQKLTKLRFSRRAFSEAEEEDFRKLLETDDFYAIRLPSNVLNQPGREYVVSSVKAVPSRDGLDEHFAIHMDGVNIIGVNYGSPGSCPYPRPLKIPSKWSFNSYTVLKTTEQASKAPILPEIVVGDNAEGEEVMPPEKSFWAKYWMYLIPLGLIVMNAITQAMNMAEEQTSGQAPAQMQQQTAGVPRGQSSVVRRR